MQMSLRAFFIKENRVLLAFVFHKMGQTAPTNNENPLEITSETCRPITIYSLSIRKHLVLLVLPDVSTT
jgi:hypothetical protein